MGDDVAALKWGGVTALLTTDALSEGTHFLDRSPPGVGGPGDGGGELQRHRVEREARRPPC